MSHAGGAPTARYLVFINKPGVMPDGKTPDSNYLVAYMLNNMTPQIRANFEHNQLDNTNFQQWKARIPQLAQITPQMIDISSGEVVQGMNLMFFLYRIVFQSNPSFMLSSITPVLQQLDYQFRSKLMPPTSPTPSPHLTSGMASPMPGPGLGPGSGPGPGPGLMSGSAPGMGPGPGASMGRGMSSRPNPMGSGAMRNQIHGGGRVMGSNVGNTMQAPRPQNPDSIMAAGRAAMSSSSSSSSSSSAPMPSNMRYLDPSMIPNSEISHNPKDATGANYTVMKDSIYYNLPKGTEIPSELKSYIQGSENPDISGSESNFLEGLPSAWEDRAGFLGIMEQGPTQFNDNNTNMYEDYNDTSEFIDISKLNISNNPVSSSSTQESYNPQAIKEMRRSKFK